MSRLVQLHLAPALVLLAVVSGCSGKPEAVPTGGARVSFSHDALLPSEIVSATLTVGPGTGVPTFVNIVQQAVKDSAGNWTAFVSEIPAGAGRTFHIEACDVAGPCDSTVAAVHHLYAGDATATITPGVNAQVYLLLQQVAPANAFNNHAPVIDSLSASASTVTPGTAVSLTVTAHDPDTASDPTNHLAGYLWTATCGTLTGATTATPTWTAPSPSADQTCTINVTVSDVCGPGTPQSCSSSVTASLRVSVASPSSGSATVTAYANTCPAVSCVFANQGFTYDSAGKVNGYEADLTVGAADVDGDDLHYVWSSVGCPGAVFTPTGANPTAEITDTGVASRTVHFKANTVVACNIRVDVRDYWHGGAPAGSGLGAARGCTNIGNLSLGGAVDFHIAPTISRIVQPNAGNQVAPATAYTFGADVSDPNGPAGYPLTIAWTNVGASGTLGTPSATSLSAPGTVTVPWTSPSPLAAGMALRLTVTNAYGLSSQHLYTIVPANQCALTPGAACDDGNACTTGTTCQADGTCGGGTPVTCAAAGQCQQAGVCNPGTGTCDYAPRAAGTTCNADSNGCTAGDACNATGTCIAGPAPACNTPATCEVATGTCVSTGNDTHSCSYAPATGATCTPSASQDHCFSTFTCDATKACNGSSPISCASGACSSGGTCNPATGTCQGGSNLPDGTTCTGTDVCQSYACASGVCTGAPKCAAGTSCSAGTCVEQVPVIASVRNNAPTGTDTAGLNISTVAGLVVDSAGATYLAGQTASLRFDGVDIASQGSTDFLIARYDPVTKALSWAQVYGDANTQTVTGLAGTQDGTVALLGQFVGTVNGKQNPRTYPIDIIHAVNASNGTSKWTKMLDSGIGGALRAIAANPALNLIAVCGYVDGTQAAAGTDQPIVPATPFFGGTRDAAIAVYNSATGAQVWARALNGNSAEECSALTIDSSGNVYAAGKFNATLDFGPGGTPVDASTTAIGKLWVAKFAAADGATLADAAFGVSGNTVANALALDSTGKLFVGGSFNSPAASPLLFGATALATAGGVDAFVAKLDPAAPTAFSALWAVRLGGTGGDATNGLAVGPFDSVLVAGSHAGLATTTGIAALSAGGPGANGFLLKLKGVDGTLQFASTYGDLNNQFASKVVVRGNEFAFGGNQNQGVINFGGSDFPVVAHGAPTLNTGTLPASFLAFGQIQ